MTCRLERPRLTRGRADARVQPRLPVPVGSGVPSGAGGIWRAYEIIFLTLNVQAVPSDVAPTFDPCLAADLPGLLGPVRPTRCGDACRAAGAQLLQDSARGEGHRGPVAAERVSQL